MPTDFIEKKVLNVVGLRKYWTEIYYNKGCRHQKLEKVVWNKIKQRAKKLGCPISAY